MCVIRHFPEIDNSAHYVVTDEADILAPAPFWNYDAASDRLNDLWETGYRPELWRRTSHAAAMSFKR